MKRESTAPGLESFWETCDHDNVDDHPLMRELCFRLDVIQRYRGMITDAEAMGDDNAVELLSKQFDQQHAVVRRIREELRRSNEATPE
ncbi:MAG: hypothetical protein ACT4O1_14995 [Gemmatimonadota bacterium]